jgi:hypothetical protein
MLILCHLTGSQPLTGNRIEEGSGLERVASRSHINCMNFYPRKRHKVNSLLLGSTQVRKPAICTAMPWVVRKYQISSRRQLDIFRKTCIISIWKKILSTSYINRTYAIVTEKLDFGIASLRRRKLRNDVNA